MRSKATWVAIFFIAATLLLSVVIDFALTDVFSMMRVNNYPVLGPKFTLSSSLGLFVAVLIGLYAAFVHKSARKLVTQCLVELDKVNWPAWTETRNATGIVIFTCFIASIILGLFDAFFNWFTSQNLFF